MYRFTRYATLQNASVTPMAIGWSMELCGYINKTYGINLKSGMELFGNLNIHWEFEIDSLDKISTLNSKMLADKTYWTMIEKGKQFWVDGSLRDQVVNFPTP